MLTALDASHRRNAAMLDGVLVLSYRASKLECIRVSLDHTMNQINELKRFLDLISLLDVAGIIDTPKLATNMAFAQTVNISMTVVHVGEIQLIDFAGMKILQVKGPVIVSIDYRLLY
jgi:hypothetical protein